MRLTIGKHRSSYEGALAAQCAAVRFDPTIAPATAPLAWRHRAWIAPIAYSRSRLFRAMQEGEPVLFDDFPVDPRTRNSGAVESLVLPAIRFHAAFPGVPDLLLR